MMYDNERNVPTPYTETHTRETMAAALNDAAGLRRNTQDGFHLRPAADEEPRIDGGVTTETFVRPRVQVAGDPPAARRREAPFPALPRAPALGHPGATLEGAVRGGRGSGLAGGRPAGDRPGPRPADPGTGSGAGTRASGDRSPAAGAQAGGKGGFSAEHKRAVIRESHDL